MTQDNGMDASPSWQELQAENAELKDALDHIRQTADNSRTMTWRLVFISERASRELNGEKYETGDIDLPKQGTPTPAQWELRYRHLRKDRDALADEVERLRPLVTLYAASLKKVEAERDALAARIEELRGDLMELVEYSTGVAGLHLNGDLAPWDELLAGGRFEGWLGSFGEVAPTNQAEGESCEP